MTTMPSAKSDPMPVVKHLFVALILTMASQAWGSVTLKGIVSLNSERGAPVAGIEIFAPGANPVTTGNDGQFVLIFREGLPGQDVRIGVKRAGWSVVNDILLDHRLPTKDAMRRFEIIVCKETERDLRVAEFYRLKGNQAVEQTYKIKLAELEGRQAATAQERDRLLRERDQALQQVQEWAKQAATRKPEEIGGSYREALRLFLDGKTDAALQLLSEERLEQEALKAQEQLNQAVQGWLLKGQLLTTQFDFDGAGRAYAQAVKYAPNSYEAWFQYSYFHQQQNHFAEANKGYKQALALARQAADPGPIATILNNLGVLHRAENRMTEARKAYEEALNIRRDLAKANPNVYRPDVAMTLNNLGVLHYAENRLTEARKAYEEARDIYRDLAKTSPDVYRPDVAMTLNNLGNLHSDENRLTEARQAYEEAQEIYRELAKTNPDVYRPDVAMILNNLGTLHHSEHRLAEARQAYEEAQDLYRDLAKTNPDLYRSYVAATLNNLGLLHRDENRLTEARQAYEEALSIRRDLAKTNPDGYRPAVAMTLNNLGVLHSDENRLAEARRAYEEALGIYRQFATTVPSRYEPYVQKVESNLAELPQ